MAVGKKVEDLTYDEMVAWVQETALNNLMEGRAFGKMISYACHQTQWWCGAVAAKEKKNAGNQAG